MRISVLAGYSLLAITLMSAGSLRDFQSDTQDIPLTIAALNSFPAGKTLQSDAMEKGDAGSETFPFDTIIEDVYLFRDACNVYLIKSGNSAILIDGGTGKVSAWLKKAGLTHIDWILHTHYHRDQCIGDLLIKQPGTMIAIGEAEAAYLKENDIRAPFPMPEKFLLNGALPDWGQRLAPFYKPGVEKTFSDAEEFEWNGFHITAVATPGHTQGSYSYFVERNGKKLCFSGDLIMKGGHIRDLYSMQWEYLKNPGIDSSLHSLEKLRDFSPDVILPSHGETILHPQSDIDKLAFRLEKVRRAFDFPRAGRWNWSGFVQVSPHVIQDCGSTTQIIFTDDGEALLYDCGDEFTPERLSELKIIYNIKHVEVIIPSHWHFDHVDGIPAIAKQEGAKVWVFERLAEHLEYPERFPTTCWTGKKIIADRILTEKERFEWGGYNFRVYSNPVHMEEQMGLAAKVDGLPYYFIGDGSGLSKDGHIRSSIHCYNGIHLSAGLLKTARSFYEADPYICIAAHSNGFATDTSDKQEFLKWATTTTDAITALLPPPFQEMGFDPYWASFYPARTHARAGEEVKIMLRLKNYTGHAFVGRFYPKAYGNISIGKKVVEYSLNAGETREFPVIVKVNANASKGIHVITADIGFLGELFAEYPQAYIETYE